MGFDLKWNVLHWVIGDGRWKEIAWDDWTAFRRSDARRVPLPGIAEGVHHFILVARDEGGNILNLVPYRYLIEADGSIGAADAEGSDRHKADDDKRRTRSPGDGRDGGRWDGIAGGMPTSDELPPGSVPDLVERLLTRPPAAASADVRARRS